MNEKGFCFICFKNRRLELHHVLPKSSGGKDEVSNIIGLCSSCHKAVHAVKKSRVYSGNLVSAAMTKCKADRRVYTRPVFGFQADQGQLIEDPGEQETIALMKDLSGQGESYSAIARRLTSEGIPTKRGGIRWHPTTVRNILLNGIHAGGQQ